MRPDLPSWLDQVLRRLIAVRPENRFDNTLECLFALEHGKLHASPGKPQWRPLLERDPLRSWQAVSAVLALLLLLSALWRSKITKFSYFGCGIESTAGYVLRRVSTAVETRVRLSRTVLAAGAAVLALTGLAGVASAETANIHVMTVRLPNGMVEQIRYTGDVPPRVVFVPQAAASQSPFAMLDRMTAMMDRQAEAMMRTINAMMAQPFPSTTEAAFGAVPTGAGVCMRSVQITYTGHGQPQVVSQMSGDCGSSGSTAAPMQLQTPSTPAHQPQTIEVKARTPYQDLMHPAGPWKG